MAHYRGKRDREEGSTSPLSTPRGLLAALSQTLFNVQMSDQRDRLLPEVEEHYGSVVVDGGVAQWPRKASHPRRLISYIAGCVMALVLVMLGYATFLSYERADELIQQSVEMDVQSVRFAKLTTSGVQVQIQALSVVDYDRIQNDDYSRALFKLGGSVLRTVTLQSEPVHIATVFDDMELNLGTMRIPPVTVDIHNHGETLVDVVIDVKPDTKSLFSILKRLLQDPDEVMKLRGSGIISVTLGLIPLGSFPLSFEHLVCTSEYIDAIDFDRLSIQNLSCSEAEAGYGISGQLMLPNPTFEKTIVGFQAPSLQFDIFNEDCNGDSVLTIFSDLITCDSFHLSPSDENITVNFSTSVGQLDGRWNEICINDGISPLDRVLKQLVTNETVPVSLKNINIPSMSSEFVNKLLKFVELDVDYKFPSSDGGSLMDSVIHNVSLENLALQMDSDGETTFVDGDVEVFVAPPKGLVDGIRIIGLRGGPILSYQGSPFGVIDLTEWHSCGNHVADEFLVVTTTLNHSLLTITDKSVFQALVKEVFLKGSAELGVDVSLDAKLQVRTVGTFQIDGIKTKGKTTISR